MLVYKENFKTVCVPEILLAVNLINVLHLFKGSLLLVLHLFQGKLLLVNDSFLKRC